MARAVLSEVQWDEGFAIPVASAENKALEEELQRKQRERANLDNRLSEYKDRINAMAEHLKNVQLELSHTQGLCRAREKETESELHFKALAEREMGRLRQEISKLENELGSLREKKNSQEVNSIFKATQKLEELKSRLNWDQQTLDAWLDESARKDEDTMAIIKYAQQDESKIRELTLSIERLTLEANQKRKVLDNELTETVTAQIALDKTAETFRQAHMERQELIRQWENTIEQMRRRDQEMQQSALMLAEVNQMIREREALIKEKKNFLASEVDNNKDCERKIAVAERQATRLQLQLQEQESNRMRLQDELETLKGTVDRAATEVEALRSNLTNMKKEISDKTTKLDETRLQNGALEEKLQVVTEAALSVEERAEQMEQMLRDQELRIKEIDTQLQRQRELLFRKSQELQTLTAKEKNATAELAGSRAALSNLDSRLSKLDQNALKQQEIMYNQDFQIQLLERKMARLRGEVNTEERQVLEKRTSELSQALEEKKKTSTTLASQLKKLQVRTTDERTLLLENRTTARIYNVCRVTWSVCLWLLKAAQEKEELQRQGDELDGKIRKTEKEIKALENTLHVVNNRNTTYRKSFNKVTESSPEYQEKTKLEEQKRAAEEKYLHKRRQIRELQEDIQGMNSTLTDLLQDEATQNQQNSDVQARILALNKELGSQQEKLGRVTKQCSKLTKEIRSAKKTKEETVEERDIELKELRDLNKTVNKMLLEVMEEHPDLQATLQMYFMQ
ncbi:hypothetical protein NFI96_020473, partial [Prochilodus magdalenae]